jgi:hypothetical protein
MSECVQKSRRHHCCGKQAMNEDVLVNDDSQRIWTREAVSNAPQKTSGHQKYNAQRQQRQQKTFHAGDQEPQPCELDHRIFECPNVP